MKCCKLFLSHENELENNHSSFLNLKTFKQMGQVLEMVIVGIPKNLLIFHSNINSYCVLNTCHVPDVLYYLI